LWPQVVASTRRPFPDSVTTPEVVEMNQVTQHLVH
jgi:hypothetical protein